MQMVRIDVKQISGGDVAWSLEFDISIWTLKLYYYGSSLRTSFSLYSLESHITVRPKLLHLWIWASAVGQDVNYLSKDSLKQLIHEHGLIGHTQLFFFFSLHFEAVVQASFKLTKMYMPPECWDKSMHHQPDNFIISEMSQSL